MERQGLLWTGPSLTGTEGHGYERQVRLGVAGEAGIDLAMPVRAWLGLVLNGRLGEVSPSMARSGLASSGEAAIGRHGAVRLGESRRVEVGIGRLGKDGPGSVR